jgi:exosortase D (VPLPA-CTERM-specific)
MNGAAADVDRLRAARAWPLPLPALVIIVLLGVVGAWLFGAGLLFIANWWQQDEYSHGWLIPPLVAFILWQRRRRIWAERAPGSWTGVALVTLGLALLLLGEAAVFKRLPALGLVPVLMGLGLAWLGPQAMRHVWVPLAFLFFAMPLPGSLYVPLSMQLQLISSELGAAILQLLGVSVLLDGNLIDLGVYKLQVAEACSGLRYLFPLAAFGFLCAWIYKAPLWARAFVFLATGPITIVMNSVRIAFTGLFVEHGSIALAEGFMHLFEGWVIFLAALAVLFALMWLLARIRGQRGGLVELLDFDRRAGAHIPPAPRTTTPAAVPAPLLVCVLLLLLAVPAKAAVAGREQLVPERPGLVTFPLAIDAWQGVPLPLETAMLAATGADDHLLADYAAAALHGAGVPVNLWIAYYDEQIRDAAA